MPQSETDLLQQTIEASLQSLAEQIGEPITPATATQLYRESHDLLAHLSYEPITLARLAGTLLVYRLKQTEPEELDWLKGQIREATEAEQVEELIESMGRTDAL